MLQGCHAQEVVKPVTEMPLKANTPNRRGEMADMSMYRKKDRVKKLITEEAREFTDKW